MKIARCFGPSNAGRSEPGRRGTKIKMMIGRVARTMLSICAFAAWTQGQGTTPAPAGAPAEAPVLARRPAGQPRLNETIRLTVPNGTPLQVALDKEVRIERAGQPIHGHVVEPVYAFDKLVIPVGAEVTGKIAQIEGVSGSKRALSALDADFTPEHKLQIDFSELALPDGQRIPMRTSVTPGSGQVVQFVSAGDAKNPREGVKDAVSEKTREAKQQAKQEWDNAMKQVKQPGKVHRVERYVLAELPVHPQYIDAGTMYFVELQQPLDFGSEPLTPELATSIGAVPPEGSVVHARLTTPLNSATAQKGDKVDAAVTQPLFDGNRLIVPQGSRMKGSVVQVQSARYMSRNGQLRFVFHELVLPDGVEQKIDAVLQGVQAGRADNLKLDSEGGAQATTPKTRYLTTAVSLGMAAMSVGGDGDSKIADPAGKASNRIVGGAGGFKLVGMVLGAVVKSRAFGYSMGTYGAGLSVYTHFIARGHDVVFPKNTAMEIGIGTRTAARQTVAPPTDAEQVPAKP